MLEHSALWLIPWSAAPVRGRITESPSAPLWAILEAETRTFLGLVRRQAWRVPFWFGYLDRPGVAVYETEDESLLFTMERGWGFGPVWLVRDADGHRIGSLRGNLARDQAGRRLAVLESLPQTKAQCWLSPEGQPLGTAAPSESGVVVTFAAITEGRPFIKMVLLGMMIRTE